MYEKYVKLICKEIYDIKLLQNYTFYIYYSLGYLHMQTNL